jgi:subtilisin family serine protease
MIISLPLQKLLEDWQEVANTGAAPDDPRFLAIAQRARIKDGVFTIIIDLNSAYPGGVTRARERVLDLLSFVALGQGLMAQAAVGLHALAPRHLREISNQYLIVRLRPEQIKKLVALDRSVPQTRTARGLSARLRAIHRLWPDNIVQRQTYGSTATIKADAARNSFGCSGRGIVWAVADSGIDGTHPHFAKHRNLEDLPPGLAHQDFVAPDQPEPLVDRFGHGTHVAGIIAGGCVSQGGQTVKATVYERDEKGRRVPLETSYEEILGVAPECKLLSLKVLGNDGTGGVTEVMAALEQVMRINGYGKTIQVHGVNLSLGYVYDPQWYACGHSPLCEVVDRLSRSGVCVVVAAGNSGYGDMDTKFTGTRAQGMAMSINDPGNAERAITVGSTHREAPHTYGVSYFSSKGPTGDGRAKPDLLAPGEKIISCRSLSKATASSSQEVGTYVEDSGTSMAAPHVSGAIAALLSVRREFIGKSDEVKKVLMSSALDLGRERSMQGSGLLNLFSALQSI